MVSAWALIARIASSRVRDFVALDITQSGSGLEGVAPAHIGG